MVRFYLKGQTVQAQFNFQGKRFRFSTKVKGDENDWDKKNQRFKSGANSSLEKNRILRSFAEDVEQAAYTLRKQGRSVSKMAIDSLLSNEEILTSSFLDFFQDKIYQYEKKLNPSTMKIYRRVLKNLTKFNSRLSWDQLDMKFYYDYTDYLRKEKNYLDVTISTEIKKVKKVLRDADNEGKKFPPDYKRFETALRTNERHALTRSQVDRFYKADLKGWLDKVRDIYVFNCFTGLRYDDLRSLDETNVQGEILKFTQSKTGEVNEVYLNDVARAILAKYENKFISLLDVPTNQAYNRGLKEAFKKAGFTDDVLLERFRNGKRERVVKKEYEVFTAHTARHTFARILIEAGADIKLVQENLGQKDIKSTMIYAKMFASTKHQRTKDLLNS